MQSSCITFVLVSIVVFLSCHFTTVYGKCSGRWAIHACYGGNGKRSGPPLTDTRTDTTDNNNKLSLLEQIILSSYDVPDLTREMGPVEADLTDDTEGVVGLYPAVMDEDFNRQRELRKTQALLTNLLLENRFRRSSPKHSDSSRR